MGGDVMRKAILASALLGAVSLSFATNGDNLIGVSPASRGMGGIGVGMPVGPTDTIFRNPAWMSYYKGFNMSFGGILFFPEVKAKIISRAPRHLPPANQKCL
jgi:long-chain fatty acid transport protein